MTTLFVVSYILLWLVVLTCVAALFALYRVNGQMLLAGRIAGEPEIGTLLPSVRVENSEGASGILGRPRARQQVVQIVSDSCTNCGVALTGLADWLARESPDAEVFVLVTGKGVIGAHASTQRLRELGANLISDPGWRHALEWQCRRVPWTMLVGTNGRLLGKQAPLDADAFSELWASVQERSLEAA